MEDLETTEKTPFSQIIINGESFFKISDVDKLRPFFMSIVSDSNHWLFIGSNGGLTAGRKNAENVIFPYYTDDKIIESAEVTGSKTVFQVSGSTGKAVWEPFSERYAHLYNLSRNLYKNVYGNKVLFEEINHDLNLTFRYSWNSSNQFGFVKKSELINHNDTDVSISFIDGLQNILPYGVGSALQNQRSNLVDAYKRSELQKQSGLGIYALSAIIVDKAEPSEALKANVAWAAGLDNPKHLLSSLQVDSFRNGNEVAEEIDIKAEKGAYFVNSSVKLGQNDSKTWFIVTNVNHTISQNVDLEKEIAKENITSLIQQDIEIGTKRLIKLNASADGLQFSQDKLRDTRHFSNTLFNIMRGGIFDNNFQIEKDDFIQYLENANKEVLKTYSDFISQLTEEFSLSTLNDLLKEVNDNNLLRLSLEYLPLKFSRRHGDPSRPWNKFSINTRDENTGAKILDYEGNWRDIFQNWEALALSYPQFIEGMIFKFLNASTFDGYNPYRVTKNGIDWETIEPDDPWSYIGYWGDHQIIYLLKFLEFAEDHKPGRLCELFDESIFVYANVPYRIKSYEQIVKNPKDTIDFDHELDQEIKRGWKVLGSDSALLKSKNGSIIHVNFVEKLLATVLSKLSNFIPEGGIWMNTQRPEWNDANNALVGNGVSMVTLYYLRRFLSFTEKLLQKSSADSVQISSELYHLLNAIADIFKTNKEVLDGRISDHARKVIMDGLGTAGSNFRDQIYRTSFSGDRQKVEISDLIQFCQLSNEYLEHSIRANEREDGLYHAYNLMTVVNDEEVSISYLSEMLEGQVSVLSSGYLSSSQALKVLDALKSSELFREDQYSYILYPNKDLPGFTQKNIINSKSVEGNELLSTLIKDGNSSIVEKDANGNYHFNGNFHNANDLSSALNKLSHTDYHELAKQNTSHVLQIFEEVFDHKSFTGRSGTFFGYEGLGSIYWHMVSKLLLAVQECCLKALSDNEDNEISGKLLEHYYEINEGIGVHKSPELYGAFPTDPYSHTPAGKGAQQPGMTGQVKEDILCRFGELGVFVKNGCLVFDPQMLRKDEFLTTSETFNYIDIAGQENQLVLDIGSLAFTYCQVPVVYTLNTANHLELVFENGDVKRINSLEVDSELSDQIFERTGYVIQINASINADLLK